MYECSDCSKPYENEDDAKKCCNQVITFDDGDFRLPRKGSYKPAGRQHSCPNVKHGGKAWLVWLSVDEGCPMCDYVYRPR